MNRKKITLLLTGLSIASSIFTGCASSGNKTQDNNKVSQYDENGLQRATERIVTEFKEEAQYPYNSNNQYQSGGYPDVAYADDITGMDTVNEFDNGTDNGFNNSVDENLNRYSRDITSDESINENGTGNNLISSEDVSGKDNINEFQNNASIMEPLNGFGRLPDRTNGSDLSDGSTNSSRQDVSGINGVDSNLNTTENPNISKNNDTTKNDMDLNNNTQNGMTPNTNMSSDINGQVMDTPQTIQEGRNTQSTVAGNIVPVRSIGGVELTGAQGSKKPQGTIRFSFKLTGDVLSTQVTNGSTQSTLADLIQKAYEETLQDANTNFEGAAQNTTAREALQKGLAEIFNPTDTGNNFTFQDSKGQIINIPYTAANICPDKNKNSQYVRRIIDIDGMYRDGGKRSVRATSQDIPITLIMRFQSADGQGNDELATNTSYTFVGLTGSTVKNNELPIKDDKVLTGLRIPQATTAKAPSTIQIMKDSSTSAIYENLSNGSAGTVTTGTVYVTKLNKKNYLNVEDFDLNSPDKVEARGTTIRFKGIKFVDSDDSIVKIEMKDSEGKTYPGTLIQVDPDNKKAGKYLQISGLRTDSRYIFTEIDITTNTEGKDQLNVLQLMKKDTAGATVNTTAIKTTNFSEPKLELGADGPKQTVTLPGGLKVQAVKNDATSLRYVLKVDNSEDNIGELRVTSLRPGEESKIQKIVDKKSKTNYYVVTLSSLSPGTDYNFVNLELDYKDYDGKDGVLRTTLAQINTKRDDKTVDNVTENTPITGQGTFTVDIETNHKADYARSTRVPLFIDDMNGRFVRMNYIPLESNLDVKVEYDGSYVNVTGLTPNSSTTITLEFVYKTDAGIEKSIRKYVTIKTPVTGDLDIKSDTVIIKENEAIVKLEYYSTPKSPIKSISIEDSTGKKYTSNWDSSTNSIFIQGLDANTEFKGLIAKFTLENTEVIEYPLTSFKTGTVTPKPTGDVANFVSRVYTIALGRQPEAEGWNFWVNKLTSKELSATEFIAENLMTQPEFIERELNKQQFVTTMYSLIVNRTPDEDGQSYWEKKYNEYREQTSSVATLRIKIAREMMNEKEFKELVTSLGLKY